MHKKDTKQYNIIQMAVVPYDWEGYHRSGITLAIRHSLKA